MRLSDIMSGAGLSMYAQIALVIFGWRRHTMWRATTLVVDKGQPGNLVSFCMDGVTKISPSRFEVRKLYNDITFIDEFFTLEFCIEQKFYAFGFQERSRNGPEPTTPGGASTSTILNPSANSK